MGGTKIIVSSTQSVEQLHSGSGGEVRTHPRALCYSTPLAKELISQCVSQCGTLGGHLQHNGLHAPGENATAAKNKGCILLVHKRFSSLQQQCSINRSSSVRVLSLARIGHVVHSQPSSDVPERHPSSKRWRKETNFIIIVNSIVLWSIAQGNKMLAVNCVSVNTIPFCFTCLVLVIFMFEQF